MAAESQNNEDRTFPDIPYKWSGKVTDEEIHQVYEHLKRERFWISEAHNSRKNHAGKAPGFVLRFPVPRTASPRLNGFVYFVFHMGSSVVVARYTEEGWARALEQ